MSTEKKNNWRTEKSTTFLDVRLAAEPKHFPATGDKPESVFVGFFDQNGSEGIDVYVSARLIRGAKRLKYLKKGDRCCVSGPVIYSQDKEGKIKGTIYDVASFVICDDTAKQRVAAATVEESSSEPAFAF